MANDDYILRDGAIDALTVSALLRNLDSVENGTAHRYRRAAERIIAGVPAADVEPKRRWIPVTDADNLPKKSTPCLVACNQWGGEIVRKATYLDSEKRFFEGEFDITEYVTHWMPSPEPPEGES